MRVRMPIVAMRAEGFDAIGHCHALQIQIEPNPNRWLRLARNAQRQGSLQCAKS